MKNNFAYFIASYGKPEKIPTYEVLQKLDAKYPIYIVVGDDDPKLGEYQIKYNNLIIFSKENYYSDIDKIGHYIESDKICTYSRLAIESYVKYNGIKYIGYLFDDINSMNLRYESGGKIKAISNYCIDDIMDIYIDLLNSDDKIYIVGPPQSSFYIGVNTEAVDSYTSRFGNMFIYDIEKPIGPYRASTVEDMSIVVYNNMVGKMSICPFGLQVNCRDPHTTKDSYGNMTKSEYYQQWSLIFNSIINVDKPQIPYKNFIPKIISDQYRKDR